jgi:pimeloyl-ACP methyl ester carboxylesterase
LRAAGHDVHTITLTGLGGPEGRQWPPINLDTHIEDVVTLIGNEKLDDVVLCGHSYAGLVIAGVADRLPGRISTLLFIDALVPRDGESVWTTWDVAQRDAFVLHSPDGIVTNPPPGVDARARPHPLACFMQPVRLGAAAYAVDRKAFVWCCGRAQSPFERVHQRVKGEGGWAVHRIPFGHDIMNEAPELLRDIILSTTEGNRKIWDVDS